MCAAVYPIKRIDWDKVKTIIEGGRPNPAAAALKYVFEVGDPDAVIASAGFVKVRYAGTGFLMIRREALEKMCAQYPQLQYKRDHSVDAATASDNRFALFECMIAEDGTYLSEDFAFCKRWIDMGGDIWADLNSKLNHVGPMAFSGDLSSQFARHRRRAPGPAAESQANRLTRLPAPPLLASSKVGRAASLQRIRRIDPITDDAGSSRSAWTIRWRCWPGRRGARRRIRGTAGRACGAGRRSGRREAYRWLRRNRHWMRRRRRR